MMETALSPRARWITAWLIGACVTWFISPAIAGDWTFTPRIVGQELYTDNVLLTPTNRRSDFVTTISPGLSISDDSPRLQAKFDYSPTLQYYALTPNLNFIGQNLYANGTATVVPELFFLDARGLLSVQPSVPGLGTGLLPTTVPSLLGPTFFNTSQGIPQSQLAQVSSFSASPYLARRFGDIGSAELRYSFSDTNFNGIQALTPLTPAGTALQNTSTTTNEATAAFVTGESLGRLQSRLTLDAAQSSGTGATNQLIGIVDSAYAINQRIAALATIGHEQINFSGLPPTHIDDLVWGVGTRLTPNPDATIVLSYGHRNGFSAPYASLFYNLTARTTLSAMYTQGLTTVAQEIANNLAISDLNQLGQTVDSRTLLPSLILNPAFGLQGGVFHTKQLTATATTDLERDHFNVSISRLESLVVAQTTLGSGTSESTTQTNASWSHDLNPRTSTTLGLGYGEFNFGAPPNTFGASASTQETIVTANLSVSYTFSPSLTGSASYSFFDRISPQPQFRLVSNVISVSLRKEF